jgi:hypothetical protein
MGAAESLALAITTQTTGTAEVEKLVAALNKYVDKVDEAKKKSEQARPRATGFEQFADGVKKAIENPLQAAGDAAKGFLGTLGPVGTGIAAAGASAVLFGVEAFGMAKSLGELGVQVQNVSLRTGLSTKEVGQFSFAAKVAGADVSIFETAMRKLSQGLADGSEDGKKAREGLRALGIEARNSATGELRPMSEIFMEISAGLNHLGEAANRNTAAVKIFGRAGIELVPTMMGLSENIAEAKKLGLGLSDDDVKRFESYHRQSLELELVWDRLKRKFKDPIAATILFFFKDGNDGHTMTLDEFERIEGVRVRGADAFRGKTPRQQEIDAARLGMVSPERLAQSREVDLQRIVSFADDRASRRQGKNIVELGRRQHDRSSEGLQQLLLEAQHAESEAYSQFVQSEGKPAPEVREKEKAWHAAAQEAARYKAQVDAVKAAEESLRGGITAVASQEKRAAESGWGPILAPVAKAMAEHAEIVEKLSKITDNAQRANLTAREQKAYSQIVIPLARDAAAKEREMWVTFENEAAKAGGKQRSLTLEGIWNSYLQDEGARLSADERIEQINISSTREDILRRSARAMGLAETQAPIGQEDQAAIVAIQKRKQLAQDLYDFELGEAARIVDFDERRVAQAHALADFRKADLDVQLEMELKVAEIQRQRVEHSRELAGNFYDSMRAGRLPDFFRQQGEDLLKGVFVNATSGMFQKGLGVLGDVGKASGMGSLFTNTLLDPRNAALADNTAALNTLTSAITGTAVGGAAIASGSTNGILGRIGRLFGIGGGTPIVNYDQYGIPSAGLAGGAELNYANSLYGSPFGDIGGAAAQSSGIASYLKSANFAKTIGITAAAVAGTMGIIGGIKEGGARGGVAAGGSLAGAAGGILAMAGVSGPAAPILAGVGLALGVITSLFGDPKQNRANQINEELRSALYMAPPSVSVNSDITGAQTRRNRAGQIESTPWDAFRYQVEDPYYLASSGSRRNEIVPGTVNYFNITMPIHAIDVKSVIDRRNDLAAAVQQAMQEGHAISYQVRAAAGR